MSSRAHTIDQAAAALSLAPFRDDAAWMGALKPLAEATGSTHGQFMGWNGFSGTPFNLTSNLSDEGAVIQRTWESCGGLEPQRNPIVSVSARGCW